MSGPYLDDYPEVQSKLKLLSAGVWREAAVDETKVNQWLQNFSGVVHGVETERKNALHLLSQFIYFGNSEIKECLKVVYQEKLIYPHVQDYRSQNIKIEDIPKNLNKQIIEKTRFLGIGNPAESGTSFLYQFRKSNNLPLSVFSSTCEVLSIDPLTQKPKLHPPTLEHVIYLDDFCGTGEQAISRMEWALKTMRGVNPNIKISYFLLFATANGLKNLRAKGLFDEVEAVIVFDDDYKAFSTNSHFYKHPVTGVNQIEAERIMTRYGEALGYDLADVLGFGNCQLLVGFFHNTPDNTLPVFWDKVPSMPWHPIFPRSSKY